MHIKNKSLLKVVFVQLPLKVTLLMTVNSVKSDCLRGSVLKIFLTLHFLMMKSNKIIIIILGSANFYYQYLTIITYEH